jgi:hypothetical protein
MPYALPFFLKIASLPEEPLFKKDYLSTPLQAVSQEAHVFKHGDERPTPFLIALACKDAMTMGQG